MKPYAPLALLSGLLTTASAFAQPTPPAPAPHGDAPTERRTVIIKRHGGPDARMHESPDRMEKSAWFGVEPGPVGPTLAAQLGLAEGTGLVIENVLPESPAEAAGLKTHDVLTKLDDQILIEVRQLQVLVRSRKAGDKVKVTYLRGGKEATATVELAEREMPAQIRRSLWLGQAPEAPMPPGWPEAPRAPRAPQFNFEGSGLPPEVVDRVMESLSQAGEHGAQALERGAEAFGQAMEGLRAPQGMRTVTVLDLGDSEITVNDGDHTLVVKGEAGQRTLRATDRDGKVVFEGPVNSPEDREKIPADLRSKYEKIHEDVRIAPEAPGQTKQIRVIKAGRETVL